MVDFLIRPPGRKLWLKDTAGWHEKDYFVRFFPIFIEALTNTVLYNRQNKLGTAFQNQNLTPENECKDIS